MAKKYSQRAYLRMMLFALGTIPRKSYSIKTMKNFIQMKGMKLFDDVDFNVPNDDYSMMSFILRAQGKSKAFVMDLIQTEMRGAPQTYAQQGADTNQQYEQYEIMDIDSDGTITADEANDYVDDYVDNILDRFRLS